MFSKKLYFFTLAVILGSIPLRGDDGHFEFVGSGDSQFLRVRSAKDAIAFCGHVTLKAKSSQYAESLPVYDPKTQDQFSIPRFVLVAELWYYPSWSPFGSSPPYKQGTVGRAGLAEDQTYIFDNKDYQIYLYEVVEKDKATGGGWATRVNVTLLQMKRVPMSDYIDVAYATDNHVLRRPCSGLFKGVSGHVGPLNMADSAPFIPDATTEFKNIPKYAN